jgi:6-pyruvoyltetrahydropterin/6-carboxytetrahydropterin synthase
MKHQSTKTFGNYTVALRQHKAVHSHCKLLHGYALKFTVIFEADKLDDMNWVVDFGSFERSGVKAWMNKMFDHTLLIEKDDPYLDIFKGLEVERLCDLRVLDAMGCESLALMVFNKLNEFLKNQDAGRCRVVSVECFENDVNSAICKE